MNRLATWGATIWPGRWQQVFAVDEFNLLPWRRNRQWFEWAALALGLTLGVGLGSLLGWWLERTHRGELDAAMAQAAAMRLELQTQQDRLSAWQQRWAWQVRQEALAAQRGQALRGLLQALQAPPGDVLLRAMSWDGHQASAELWVVHPDLALPWLQRHWQPAPQTPWHSVGDWQAIRREPGTLGQVGATVWQGRWQSPGPLHAAPSGRASQGGAS